MCKINNVYIYTISIHALLAESDIVFCAIVRIDSIFLSTLSLRRATWYSSASSWLRIYFYPRSPCGERRAWPAYRPAACRISIHALLAESDAFTLLPRLSILIFLSTLSLRRATAKVHKTVGHFCAYGTNFMGIASSC